MASARPKAKAPAKPPASTAPSPMPSTAQQRRDWSARTEQSSLRLSPALLAQAQANSLALVDTSLLALLANELALTRGPELTLAYRSVVMVSAGFKKTQQQGSPRLTLAPCVVFIVRRKWKPGQSASRPAQDLPRWLVAYADQDGERLPFALPTDVQEETAFIGAVAQGHGATWTEPPGRPWEIGAIACAVELAHDNGVETCLLSAQHVFTPEADVDSGTVEGGLLVRPLDSLGARLTLPTLAITRAWGGLLRGEQDPHLASFDVQLAQFTDIDSARQVVGAPTLLATEPWVPDLKRLLQLNAQHWLHLVVPQNHPDGCGRAPLKAQLDSVLPLPFAISYRVRHGRQRSSVWVYHQGLLKLQIEGPLWPLAGDSGSAVVVPHDDGSATLVGLYIGGNQSAAYVIPAWQLFDARLYQALPAGAQLRPISI